MTEKIDCLVIGAGVVGLAVARELALSGREVLLLDAENAIGMQTSSRNSEVIHAGIYYKKDSLKAALCTKGRKQLYDYCDTRGVPYQKYGKLIVASYDEQVPALHRIYQKGLTNGVHDLKMLDADTTLARAPDLRAVSAIWSPSTGVIDSHQLMLALHADFENAGGTLALGAPVIGGIASNSKGIEMQVGGEAPLTLKANTVVNCAGLWAAEIASAIEGMPKEAVPKMYYAKGSYFSYSGRSPFNTLIYPIPFVGGLGVHLTLDIGGAARFGPDIEWVKSVDYTVDEAAHRKFLAAIRTYWPTVDPNRLHPSYAGVRPKIVAPAIGDQDFVISAPAQHGIKGLYHLYGFDSPGLTSCLAIAEYVKCVVLGRRA